MGEQGYRKGQWGDAEWTGNVAKGFKWGCGRDSTLVKG